MLRKQLIILIAVFGVMMSALTAYAEDICTMEFFAGNLITLSEQLNTTDKTVKITEEYNDCSDILKEAASRGLVPLEGIKDSMAVVVKQDAIRLIYDLIVRADSEFAISEERAEEILSTCYDNALLKKKNRVSYAAMIRHGVVGVNGLTNPGEILTETETEKLMRRTDALFRKKQPVTINGNVISIGSSVNELLNKLGKPSRIDKSEYDFDWYVYNSDYLSFIMFGVRDDVVCAYYSNAANFAYGQLKSGTTDTAVNEDPNLRLIRDKEGKLNAIYYNSAEPFYMSDSNVQASILTDLINAHRAKSGLLTFVSQDVETVPMVDRKNAEKRLVNITASGDCFEAYDALVREDNGDGILSHAFSVASEVHPRLILDNQWEILAFNAESAVVSLPRGAAVEKSEADSMLHGEDITEISTPGLTSPKMGSKTKGGSLVLKLKERTANRYLVKLYNCETEQYDVNAYINCKSDKIIIPAHALTYGNVYRACVIAVSGNTELTGNTVEFTYGEAKTPITLISPKNGTSTYDDEIEINVHSSAYKNFRVDVYNSKDEPVLTKMFDTERFILESLPADVYKVCVTAVSNADGEDKASASAEVQIKYFAPIIREFVLEQGEDFDYYYGDGEKWLYFYDAETIAVSENKTITVLVPDDMAGDPDPAEDKDGGDKEPVKTKAPEIPKDLILPGVEAEDDTPETALDVRFERIPGVAEPAVLLDEPEEAVEKEQEADNTEASEENDDKKSSTPTPTQKPSNSGPVEKVAEPDEIASEKDSEDAAEQEEEEVSEASPHPEVSESPEPSEKEEKEEKEEKPKTTRKKESKKQVSVTVYKTKITQRIVPATKRYKALAVLIPQRTRTTGAFIKQSRGATPTQTGNAIAALALSYQGVPYVWGGTSPTGFDCSGLVKYVCNSLGINNVERTSAEQFKKSGVFVDRDALIPGDLVFFQKDNVIHHVGIYIGNDMFVHAPHTGDVVKISSLNEDYYKAEYAGAKRVA